MKKHEDMPNGIGAAEGKTSSVAESLGRFERERLTRREAFARIGFRAAAAVVAVLTADDLLRKVGEVMAQHAGDNQVATAVAQEFRDAGVAFASGPSGCTECGECVPNDEQDCEDCPSSCGTAVAGGPKKKPKPKCVPDYFWADCAAHSQPGESRITCCERRCYATCPNVRGGEPAQLCVQRCAQLAQN